MTQGEATSDDFYDSFPADRPSLQAPVHESTLSGGIVVVRDWAPRTAVVIGSVDEVALRCLDRLELITLRLDPAAIQAGSMPGPFAFIVIGADLLVDDTDVERLQVLHRCCPTAKMLLALPPTEAVSAEVLIRAMRAGVCDAFDSSSPEASEVALSTGLRQMDSHRERVLAIGAHPDDVEIGCGGTLLDHRLRGDVITVLTLSRGAVGGDQAQRLEESTQSATALGARLIFGDMPDTQVDPGITTIRLVEQAVAATAPTVVYVHSTNDNHQDHRAVSVATASATRGVRRVFAYQSPSATNLFRPTSFVPIDTVLDRKVELLQMFDSQNGRSYLEPDLVVAGCRYWARHLGASARYAEPFEVIRSVGDLRHAETAPSEFVEPLSWESAARSLADLAVAAS